MSNKLLRRADAVIIAAVALLSLMLFLLLSPRGEGKEAVVSYRGEIIDTVTLPHEPFERLYTVGEGEVRVRFEDDGVSIVSSTCAGQNCVHTAKINNAGEGVLCLPLAFSVVLSGESTLDGVTG